MRTLNMTLVLMLLLAACASAPETSGSSFGRDPSVAPEGTRVWRYTSRPWGFATNSFVIEGPTGLVVIDVQFLPSAAIELVERAEKQTGKKVELAIVLHANPDKFNGTAALQARGIKVVTSAQVLALMPAIHEKRVASFYDRYKPDYPRELPRPDSFGEHSQDLTAGGVTVTASVMGAACSEAHVVVTWEGHAFVGDLVANQAHAWLEIGRTDEWLRRLDELDSLTKVEWVHPGRGASGGPELLAMQKAYLQTVIDLVAAERPTLAATAADIGRVTAQVEAAYPGYAFPVFLRIGLPAEWKRQAALRRGL